MHTRSIAALLFLCATVTAAQPALVPIGPTQSVPANLPPAGALPAVANAPDGRFIVAYGASPGGNTIELRYQLFSPTAEPLSGDLRASETPVVITLEGADPRPALAPRVIFPIFYSQPKAAMNAAGESFLVWSGGPGTAVDIRGRLLRRNGTPLGGELVINTVLPGAQGSPVVAALRDGWVVAWHAAEYAAIKARLYDRAGAPRGAEFLASDRSPGVQFQPSVAALPDGGFLLAWTSEVPPVNDGEVAVRRFDASGTPAGPSFLANTTTASTQTNPALATNPAGGFTVTWSAVGDKVDVFAQAFASDGTKVGPEQRVNVSTAQNQVDPQVASDGLGRFAIAWSQQNFNAPEPFEETLFLRPYVSSALPLASEFKIAPSATAPAINPGLAMDFGGDVLLAGTGPDGGVFFQRFTQPCLPGPTVLCLQGGRFKVEAAWRTNQGTNGMAQAVPLTADTGYFWFFNSANVEMVVKVLNACSLGTPRYWVFAGGLTNVEVDLQVTDTLTGKVRSYKNPLVTQYQPIQDTGAFATCAAASTAPAENAAPATALDPEALFRPAEARGSCVPGPNRLCLRNGRFEVRVAWQTQQGNAGAGTAVQLTPDTGYFWFFNPANVEMVIKVLNACGLNGSYWVFAGGLTNQRAEITVTDTATGIERRYTNPLGTPFQPLQDTAAFGTCP